MIKTPHKGSGHYACPILRKCWRKCFAEVFGGSVLGTFCGSVLRKGSGFEPPNRRILRKCFAEVFGGSIWRKKPRKHNSVSRTVMGVLYNTQLFVTRAVTGVHFNTDVECIDK